MTYKELSDLSGGDRNRTDFPLLSGGDDMKNLSRGDRFFYAGKYTKRYKGAHFVRAVADHVLLMKGNSSGR